MEENFWGKGRRLSGEDLPKGFLEGEILGQDKRAPEGEPAGHLWSWNFP